MIHRIFTTTVALAAIMLAGTDAHAQDAPQRSTVRGLSAGVHGATTALTLLEDRSTSLGGGLGVAVGYGFSDRFAVHSLTTGAFMSPRGRDRYLLSHVDVEGRYSFGSRSSAWAPHLALGATGRTGRFAVPDAAGGGTTRHTTLGLSAGGGLSYHLTPSTSLDWSLRYTFGDVAKPSCPDSAEAVRTCAASTRASFGVSWYPFAR